jgi:hypothetical protein
MAFVLRFGFVVQIVAAFVIFVLGYISLFVSLMLVMLLVRGLYESVKWVRTSTLARAAANRSMPSRAAAFDRPVRISSVSPANERRFAGLTFHLALNRRRPAGNYSLNHPGGAPR